MGRLLDALKMAFMGATAGFRFEWHNRSLKRQREYNERKAYEEVWAKLEQEAMDELKDNDREFVIQFMVAPDETMVDKFASIVSAMDHNHSVALVRAAAHNNAEILDYDNGRLKKIANPALGVYSRE